MHTVYCAWSHNYKQVILYNIFPTWGLYHSNWLGFNYHKPQPLAWSTFLINSLALRAH